ncbi:MAG TPA: hypothetical protein VFA20_19940 [Myxococcaceae bacterium]|nr:hypothetical protein [Myxococcaceae bacterium]
MSAPQQLPWHARAALAGCTVLAAMVGVGATGEIMRLRRLSEIPALFAPNPLLPPEALAQAEAVARASMFGMRSSRLVVLSLLFIACLVTFLTVLRLWRPLGLPRGGMLRLASFAALGCALLRVVDGAQDAVIFRRFASALAVAMSSGSTPALPDPDVARLATDLQVALHMGWTLVVASAFLILSQYFRSPKARKLFTAGDPA